MKRRQVCEWWYRIRWGHWCFHRLRSAHGAGFPGAHVVYLSTFTPWRIVDGMRKHRWCTECGRAEWA